MSAAVLATSDSLQEEWQDQNEDVLLSRRLAGRPLLFESGPPGELFVHNLDGPPPAWIGTVLGKLEDLSSLPANWDGYGAKPMSSSVVVSVLNLLAVAFVKGHAPFPDLVPTTSGGAQIEWHVGDLDLEIEFTPTEGLEVYFCDGASGVEWEGDLLKNLDRLGRALRQLQ